jgi:hypothetical protein
MRRRIRHPAAAAGGAYRPPLAGKRDNPVLPANVTMHPQKTIGQYSAIQKGPQLPFNKFRNRAIPFLLSGQEGLQMLGDNSIKRVIFRIPGAVCGFGITDEETFIPKFEAIAI